MWTVEPRWKTAGVIVALLSVVVLGVALRVAPHASVLQDGHVNLVASDSHYYVRFAQLQLEALPGFATFDPLLAHPVGAEVHWPALHTWMVALIIAVAGPASHEAAAAWVGPVLSLVLLTLSALLARRFAPTHGVLIALAILAFTPTVVSAGVVGEADHHVHEAFLAFWLALLAARTLERPGIASVVALGVLLGAGRLFTTSAFLPFLPLLLGFLVAARIRREQVHGRARPAPREPLMLAAGVALTAALVSLATVLWVGVPSSLEYERLSLFHPLALLGVAAIAFGLSTWRGELRRPGLALGAVGVAILGMLSGSTLRALSHLRREDPLLALAGESRPLLASLDFAASHLGRLPLVLGLAIVGLVAQAKARDARAAPAWVLCAVMAIGAAFQVRFASWFVGAAAALVCLAWTDAQKSLLAPSLLARLPAARLGLTVLALVLLALPHLGPPEPVQPQLRPLRVAVDWLTGVIPSDRGEEDAVLAGPFLGHPILLWGGLPVVASPFSQMRHFVEANLRGEDFFSATTEERGLEATRRARAKWILATPGALPGGPHEGAARWLLPAPASDADAGEAHVLGSAHFRFLYGHRAPEAPFTFLFERVEGARVQGVATPGARVTFQLLLQEPAKGERWTYRRATVADAGGSYSLTLAQPTGPAPPRGGIESAAAYEVRFLTDEGALVTRALSISEEEVRGGATIALPPLRGLELE